MSIKLSSAPYSVRLPEDVVKWRNEQGEAFNLSAFIIEKLREKMKGGSMVTTEASGDLLKVFHDGKFDHWRCGRCSKDFNIRTELKTIRQHALRCTGVKA